MATSICPRPKIFVPRVAVADLDDLLLELRRQVVTDGFLDIECLRAVLIGLQQEPLDSDLHNAWALASRAEERTIAELFTRITTACAARRRLLWAHGAARHVVEPEARTKAFCSLYAVTKRTEDLAKAKTSAIRMYRQGSIRGWLQIYRVAPNPKIIDLVHTTCLTSIVDAAAVFQTTQNQDDLDRALALVRSETDKRIPSNPWLPLLRVYPKDEIIKGCIEWLAQWDGKIGMNIYGPETHATLAAVFAQCGDTDRASAHARQITNHPRWSVSAWLAIGSAGVTSAYMEARHITRHSNYAYFNDLPYDLWRLIARATNDSYDRAKAITAARKHSDTPEAVATIVEILLEKGQIDEARVEAGNSPTTSTISRGEIAGAWLAIWEKETANQVIEATPAT